MSRRDHRRGPVLADWHLWTAVTNSVDPLRLRPLRNFSEAPLPLPTPNQPALKHPPGPFRAEPRAPFLPSYQAPAQKTRTKPGQEIEPKMHRRLMRGHIEIDGTLDLHGMRQHEAREALNRYLPARQARGDRTILVITGKGLKKVDGDAARIIEKGVLRAMLPQWLSEPGLAPLIAGWERAAQSHGGEGAFYVRLRRSEA